MNLPDYVIDFSADINGTCLVGEIQARYSHLEKLFGEPEEMDGYKVSGEWSFKDRTSGDVFTLYDWKSTDLYDEGLPPVEEFRSSTFIQQFNIGGKPDRIAANEKFIGWLKTQLDKRF